MAKQDVRFREMMEPAEQGQGMTNEKYWRDKAALHLRQGQHHLAHGAVFRARIAAQLSQRGGV